MDKKSDKTTIVSASCLKKISCKFTTFFIKNKYYF